MPMQPPRVHWETVDQATCEAMVKVLIQRLHPTVQAIDGSGGDGGIDLLMRTEDGLVIYQIKSFTGRLGSARRSKVAKSLEAASQHGPVKWRLVVPIDPTPGELAWFEQLTEQYPFECVWDGKTWLDSEMAQRPEIARCYLHGGEAEVVSLLESIGAEHPAVEHGVATASFERVAEIVARLNKLDPHYELDVTARHDGTVSWTIRPRYPGAVHDRPAATARFVFPDTTEGTRARQMVEELFDYGAPCVVPSEYVAEVSIHVPAGLEEKLTGGDLALSGSLPEPREPTEAALRAVDAQGAVLAQLSVAGDERTAGHRGVRLMFRDKSAALRVQAQFDAGDGSGMMTVRYEHPYEFSPLDLLPAAKFWEAIGHADHLALVVNGETVGRGMYDADWSPGEGAAGYVRFTEHLVQLQTATGVFFNIRGEVTAEDGRDVVLASLLLRGERVTQTWTELSISVKPEGRGPFEAALGAAAPAGTLVPHIRIGEFLSITVQGNTIPIGMVVREIESARVLSWIDAGEEAPPGATTLTLVPAETNTLTMFLDRGH